MEVDGAEGETPSSDSNLEHERGVEVGVEVDGVEVGVEVDGVKVDTTLLDGVGAMLSMNSAGERYLRLWEGTGVEEETGVEGTKLYPADIG